MSRVMRLVSTHGATGAETRIAGKGSEADLTMEVQVRKLVALDGRAPEPS